MNAFDPVAFFFAPFNETNSSLKDSMGTFVQGTRAMMSGVRAVNHELSRFAKERFERHLNVISAMFAGPWPASAMLQMTDYLVESAEAWDAEQSRLAGIMADALTESLLAEEVIGRLAVPALPYSPWLDRHNDAPITSGSR